MPPSHCPGGCGAAEGLPGAMGHAGLLKIAGKGAAAPKTALGAKDEVLNKVSAEPPTLGHRCWARVGASSAARASGEGGQARHAARGRACHDCS